MSKRAHTRRLWAAVALLTLLLPLSVSSGAAVSSRQATDARTFIEVPATTADTIPPAVVVDLQASTGASPGTVDLSWIAPGDDGADGSATAYLIRYHTLPITEENWAAATVVPVTLIPQLAGSPEGLTVTGLAPGTPYHFALKTQDDAPNTSGVSNTPRAQAKGLPHRTFLPVTMQGFTDTPPVIPDTTKVLPESTTRYLTAISGDGAIFTFSQETPALSALAPGDIMVGDVAEHAPDGFLRKVVSVTFLDGQVLVNTEDAALEEAIESGSLAVGRVLTPEDVESGWLAPGVTQGGRLQGGCDGGFCYTLTDVVLYEAGGAQVKVNGSIRFEPVFDWRLKIKWFKVQELAFIVGADERAALEITSGVTLSSLKKEVVIAEHKFTPFKYSIGPVPVVIRPVLTVSVGANGDVQVGMRVGVTQEARMRVGLRYTHGAWEFVKEFSNRFGFNPPELAGGLTLRGYAGAQVTLRLYGVVGPYVRTNAYLKLAYGSACAVPWSRLFAGLEVAAGVEAKIFGKTIVNYKVKLFDYTLLLTVTPPNCSPCYPEACIPSPPPILTCADIPQCSNVRIVGCDPHGLACPGDRYGCAPLITCWVSDPTPYQYSDVTVFGKLRQANCLGVAGAVMNTAWHYKTVTSYCDGVSGSDGVASCTRGISTATVDYTVNIDVTMTHGGQGYPCRTSFTPQ